MTAGATAPVGTAPVGDPAAPAAPAAPSAPAGPAPAGAGRASGAARRPGRPRDEELDAKLIGATLALIDAEQEVTVSRVLAGSGVSRAGLYRRWPSLTSLIAAALDVGRAVPAEVPVSGEPAQLRDGIMAMLLGEPHTVVLGNYSEARFRQRIRLVMADRELQRTYWDSHVRLRRGPVERALAAGVRLGVLRAELDVAAAFDSIAGIAYYQIVVRGESLDAPETRARVRAGLDIVWRGMRAAAE
ncbi:TetR/AcrR family transcriptional regulator C-terminal ligand-binding domain-containing protein [Leucobacter luti]|uniref:TetR family transcriptional regulator n=1 Tax=Leucobacter luti TaxID=340320 RepID=A0A4Q7U909_9MICO|nr:TetR/AcrR family transcriptional regulator C-terminal ligand-binding domain-containing protein [Leucobacter luti]RZT68868.1 TetR family transcriptional regulator [Leucobacter luti]